MQDQNLQKQKWIDSVEKALIKANILKFLVDEIVDSMYYLNLYKAKNVYDNVDYLVEKMKKINDDYVAKISS